MPGKSKKGGGLESKPAYNFNAGLRKAAKDGKLDNKPKFKAAVENSGFEMSYKMVNKKGLKMAGNPSMKFDPTKDPNLSLMNDPNLSGLDLPSKGDNVNFEGENMNVLGVDVNKIFKNEIGPDDPYKGTDFADSDTWAKQYADGLKGIGPLKNYASKYTIDGKGKATGNKVLDSFNAVVNLGSIPQPGTPEVKGDAFTSYDKRQEIRQGKNITGQSIRNKNKIRRAENRIEKLNRKSQNTGLDSKDIFGNKNFVKKQLKLQDKIDKSKIRKKGLEERQDFINISKSNYKKQIEQAVNPDLNRSNAVILQQGSQGSSSTPAKSDAKNVSSSSNVEYKKLQMKPMQLSPKAMNYFNKKKK